jgi:mannosylglycerate hydrolase
MSGELPFFLVSDPPILFFSQDLTPAIGFCMQTLHIISHTHWDREWYLTFQQFRLKLIHLVDGLLNTLDNDIRYRHFMLDGQTIALEDYLEVRPEREQDLRRHVLSGRLLIGPWYILPDEFLVSPEATVRNLLEGRRISRQFGTEMPVGYIPDPFGHIGQMPQILRGFDIETASVMRGLADEPCEFWWQSPDGSKVLMSFLRGGYGNAAGILNSSLHFFSTEVSRLRDNLAPYSASSHLLLMQGTDHMEPHPGTPEAIDYVSGKLNGTRLIHSTLPDYFCALLASLNGKDLPVVEGELRSSKLTPLLPAVLSTRIWIKQRNRACENLLEKYAEPFSVWAHWMPGIHPAASTLRSPAAVLRQAWRLLMQCHPHDSICGCSIDQVHDEMRPRFDQVEQMGNEITRQSLENLAESVDTSPPPAAAQGQEVYSALVIFNPVAGPRSDLVSAVVEGVPESGDYELVDDRGEVLPFQAQGLGSQELINMVMSPEEFRGGIGMVAEGTIMGLKIRSMEVQRQANEAIIRMVLSEKGEPDLEAWEQGRQEASRLLSDESIRSYQVHARSTSNSKVVFVAPSVPGYGYRTFWVRSKAVPARPMTRTHPIARAVMPLAARLVSNPNIQRVVTQLWPDPSAKPPYRIENEFFTVEAQPDGTLDVTDRRTGVLFRGQNRFVDGGDRGDEYNYSPPAVDSVVTAHLKSARVEKGNAQQVLVLVLEMNVPEQLSPNRKSRVRKTSKVLITSRVTLGSAVPRIDIHTEIQQQARDHRLRVHFPAPFSVFEAVYDGHFETVRRPIQLPSFDDHWVERPRPEVPQRAFTAITAEKAGLLVANRGLPEVETLQHPTGQAEIALTLLRCVGWLSRDDFPERKGHAGPYLETPGAQMPGNWAFDYAIVPFEASDWTAAYEQAYAFEAPLCSAGTLVHPGSLAAQDAFLSVEPAEFVISTIKTAEDILGWMVRGYNLSREEVVVRLKTRYPIRAVEQTNLAEEKIKDCTLEQDGSIVLPVRGAEIITLRFQ